MKCVFMKINKTTTYLIPQCSNLLVISKKDFIGSEDHSGISEYQGRSWMISLTRPFLCGHSWIIRTSTAVQCNTYLTCIYIVIKLYIYIFTVYVVCFVFSFCSAFMTNDSTTTLPAGKILLRLLRVPDSHWPSI